ncbi:MAG: hypothetical protein ABL998_20610, partial [Planctomycetota bacterium]
VKQLTRGRRSGYTLVELVISSTFLASLLLIAGFATDRTMSAFRERRAEQESVVAANRVLQRVAGELTFAAGDGLGPATVTGTGSERIEFRVAIGGGALGPARALALELEDGGLVDEQRVLWIEGEGGPDERRTTFATAVAEYLEGELANGLDDNENGLRDERGLSFVREGEAVRVRLTMLYRSPGGAARTRTLETLVFPRN